jgi:transposase
MIFRSTTPIIIGGCHRSGTTLVRRLLNAHHNIYCGPEVKLFRDLYGHYDHDPLAHLRFSHSARTLVSDDELLQEWGNMYIKLQWMAAKKDKKRRWADKNPENVMYLSQWERLLGQRWLYVHLVRNPLDTLASIDEVGFDLTIPRDLPGRIAHLKRYMELGLEYVEQNPKRAKVIIYEELVTRPQKVLNRLMQFLGENAEQAQIDFADHRHKDGIEDPKINTTTGIHAKSVQRWKSRINSETAEIIMQETGHLWSKVDPDGIWIS